MRQTATTTTVPPEWLESLARSKAQIAAGETVPLLPLLDELREAAERIESAHGTSSDEVDPTLAR